MSILGSLSAKKHKMMEAMEERGLTDVPRSEVLDMTFGCERIRKMEAGSPAKKGCFTVSEKLFHVLGNFIFSRLKRVE